MKVYRYNDTNLSPNVWETYINRDNITIEYRKQPSGFNGPGSKVSLGQTHDKFQEANARAICQLKPALRMLWNAFVMAMLDDKSISEIHGTGEVIDSDVPQEKWGPFATDIFAILTKAGVAGEYNS